MPLLERIKLIVRHKFVRKAAVFQAANGLASVLQSLAGVVLARLLRPELFGQFSIAFSVASVASIILASGVQEALMPVISRAHASGDKNEVLDGFAYWAKWILVSLACVGLIIVILPPLTVWLYGNSSIGVFAGVILAASLVSSSILSITQVGAQISGRIGMLSGLTLGDMLLRYGAAIALVLAGLGALGASLGHLVGALIVALGTWFIYSALKRQDPLLPSVMAIVHRAQTIPWGRHFSQSAWVWVDRNFGMLYQSLPVAMVGLAVPLASVSHFKLAFGYVNTGMALIGPLSVLLNTEFARMQVQEPHLLVRNFIRISLIGMGLAGLVVIGQAIVGYWVFLFLYGPAYMAGVPLVYGFIPYGLLFGLGIGLGPMWRVVGKVRISVIINVVVLGIGLPLGLALTHLYGIWGGVVMVTLWYGFGHLFSFFYVLRALKLRS